MIIPKSTPKLDQQTTAYIIQAKSGQDKYFDSSM
jgi:hypothetical protein